MDHAKQTVSLEWLLGLDGDHPQGAATVEQAIPNPQHGGVRWH